MAKPLVAAGNLAAVVPPTLPLAVTLDEAARLASSSVSTIRRAIASGELLAAKLGTAVRVRIVDLDRWLAERAGSDQRAVASTFVDRGDD